MGNKNKINYTGHDRAELLNRWTDDGDLELYGANGKIEGKEKEKILSIMREIIMMSPYVHKCTIIDINTYKKRKEKIKKID